MQVTIGITNVARELTFETNDSQERVLSTIKAAQGSPAVVLDDDKGRKVYVPTSAIAYVGLGESEPRRVGFAL